MIQQAATGSIGPGMTDSRGGAARSAIMSEEYQLFFELEERIYKRLDQYDSFSDAEKTFFLISWLMMQVFNGGWHQWYHNWPEPLRSQRVEETLDALREIGAPNTLILVQRAVVYLEEENPDSLDPGLAELNQEFWDFPDPLTELTQDWAAERLDQFA